MCLEGKFNDPFLRWALFPLILTSQIMIDIYFTCYMNAASFEK